MGDPPEESRTAAARDSHAPRLSIRLLTHNYGRFLDDCLRSVLAQSFEEWEVVLIDDASTDDSWAIAERYARLDPRIRPVRHDTNRGFVASLLHSVEMSRGDYLVQLDADDWFAADDALERLVAVLDDHPTVAFCFSPYALHDEHGRLMWVADGLGRDVVLSGEEAIVDVMRFIVPHSGTVVRRRDYDLVGGYDPARPYGPDMTLFYALCAVGDVGYVHRPLIGYRVHGTNMSSSSRWSTIFDESVDAIETVFDGPLGERIRHPRRARRAALRTFLHHQPTKAVFAGQHRAGWALLARHARRRPWLTVATPNTLQLAARSLLGHRGHEALRRLAKRLFARRPHVAGMLLALAAAATLTACTDERLPAADDRTRDTVASNADVVVHLGAAGRPFPATLLGTNVPAWLGPDRLADPRFMDAIEASGTTLLRMPGGSWSNAYDWHGCETGDHARCHFDGAARPRDFVGLLEATGLPGMWTVSINDTAESAAALVAYFNGDLDDSRTIGTDRRGRDWGIVGDWARLRLNGGQAEPVGLRLWEIGNEVYGATPESGGEGCAPFGWEHVWTCDGTEYVTGDGEHDGYLDIRSAMTRIDPAIEVGAVGVGDPGSWGNWGVDVVAAAGDALDFYSVHHYDFDRSPSPEEAIRRPASTWPQLATRLRPVLGDRTVAVTEYNLVSVGDADTEQSMVRALGALHLADTIGQLALAGVEVANQWNLANGVMSSGTDYGLVDADTLEPNPQFHALSLWSEAGPALHPATVASEDLRAYPTVHPDGRVTTILVHLASEPSTIEVAFSGTDAPSGAEHRGVWAETLTDRVMRVLPATHLEVRSDRIEVELPPHSITILETPGAPGAGGEG